MARAVVDYDFRTWLAENDDPQSRNYCGETLLDRPETLYALVASCARAQFSEWNTRLVAESQLRKFPGLCFPCPSPCTPPYRVLRLKEADVPQPSSLSCPWLESGILPTTVSLRRSFQVFDRLVLVDRDTFQRLSF